MMRRWRTTAVGLASAACLLVACGEGGPTGGLAADPTGEPKARRYGVLRANPVCTPSSGACNAAFGGSTYDGGASTLCFSLVDGPTDSGIGFVTVGGATVSGTPVGITLTPTAVSFTLIVQDPNAIPHTAFVEWTFNDQGVRQVTIDGVPNALAAYTEGFLAGACELPQAPCVF